MNSNSIDFIIQEGVNSFSEVLKELLTIVIGKDIDIDIERVHYEKEAFVSVPASDCCDAVCLRLCAGRQCRDRDDDGCGSRNGNTRRGRYRNDFGRGRAESLFTVRK